MLEAAGTENKKNEMNNIMVLQEDYFQTNAEERLKSQTDDLNDRTWRLARDLPLHNILHSNYNLQSEHRWDKTKNWRPYDRIKESDLIEILVEDVGKV